MIELAAKAGYQAVSIAQVSSHAGVSSATFYEQFEDKEDCLLAAYDAARERVLPRSGDCPPSVGRSGARSLMDLSERLQSDPDAGSMVFVEALAGEARMRRHREAVLERDEATVAHTWPSNPGTGRRSDIPVAALEGARRYIISRHLRTHSVDLLPGDRGGSRHVDGLLRGPVGCSPWSTSGKALFSAAEADRVVQLPEQVLLPPPRLPRGRHNLPPAMVARGRAAQGSSPARPR